MTNLSAQLENLKASVSRHGWARSVRSYLENALNKIVYYRIIHIIVLRHENLSPEPPCGNLRHGARAASIEDLLRMQADGIWEMGEDKIAALREGDQCLLSLVDGQLAGYTWIHSEGRPRLFPELRLSTPKDYLYNYAGFTLPKFRGYGLQSHRHRQILSFPQWKDKKGLVGYVDAVNWSSQKGQSKSGYQRLGSILMIGPRHNYAVFISKAVRDFGIGRIEE
ncbi:MAG: hypothetical protein AAB036_06610 [Elusimicrobiota bacterium]